MATLRFQDLLHAPEFRRMLEQEADRIRRNAEEWERMFPREHTCQTRDECDAAVARAVKRLADGDYPPTEFGEWMIAEDLRLVNGG